MRIPANKNGCLNVELIQFYLHCIILRVKDLFQQTVMFMRCISLRIPRKRNGLSGLSILMGKIQQKKKAHLKIILMENVKLMRYLIRYQMIVSKSQQKFVRKITEKEIVKLQKHIPRLAGLLHV